MKPFLKYLIIVGVIFSIYNLTFHDFEYKSAAVIGSFLFSLVIVSTFFSIKWIIVRVKG